MKKIHVFHLASHVPYDCRAGAFREGWTLDILAEAVSTSLQALECARDSRVSIKLRLSIDRTPAAVCNGGLRIAIIPDVRY